MSESDKLIMLRVMLNESAEAEELTDDFLNVYLIVAGQKIINRAYPYDGTITEVPDRYGVLQCEIAAYLINKIGAEGETSHTENGISRTYASADVPEDMLAQIMPFAKVIQ